MCEMQCVTWHSSVGLLYQKGENCVTEKREDALYDCTNNDNIYMIMIYNIKCIKIKIAIAHMKT